MKALQDREKDNTRVEMCIRDRENTEIVTRAFGNDPVRVAQMSKAYMDGLHTIPGFACTAKHFPGNGLDFRDAHLSNNVNTFSVEEWDKTYGLSLIHI